MITHYAVLEISEQATPTDIRRAYRRLVKLTHPDRTPDPKAHRRYLAITEAYKVLNEPVRRQYYDRKLREQRSAAQPKVEMPFTAATPPTPPPPWARRPPPPIWRQFRVPKKLDFPAYAQASRRWGRVLLVLPILILLDYFALQRYVTATFVSVGTVINQHGHLQSEIGTSHGEFSTSAVIPLTVPGFRVRTSWLFEFVSEAYLPSGVALPLEPSHTTLLGFTTMLLLLAAASQLPGLSHKGRVNITIVATVVWVILLLMVMMRA